MYTIFSSVHDWTMILKIVPRYVNQTLPPKEQHSKKWFKSVSVTYNALKGSSIEYTAVGHQKINDFHHSSSQEVFYFLLHLKHCPIIVIIT